MLKWKFSWIPVAALVCVSHSSVAWSASSDITVKQLSPNGDPTSVAELVDDHILAVVTYDQLATTKMCGGAFGRTYAEVTVRADGYYAGTETRTKLDCKHGNVRPRNSIFKHDGKLTSEQLAKFIERLRQMTSEQARTIATTSKSTAVDSGAHASIRFSSDPRGVLSVAILPNFEHSGQAASDIAQFMQDLIEKGKIN